MNKQTETSKGNFLTTALVGTSMAFILMGKVIGAHGYSFFTVSPAVLLLFCLWWPFLSYIFANKNSPSNFKGS